jgi:hypothetical protein
MSVIESDGYYPCFEDVELVSVRLAGCPELAEPDVYEELMEALGEIVINQITECPEKALVHIWPVIRAESFPNGNR